MLNCSSADFNDLIGLPYQWGCCPEEGATDCFQLMCLARRRMGLRDLAEQFQWVYEQWDAGTLPRGAILRWLHETGRRIDHPEPGATAYVSESALGTATEHGILFIAPGQNVVHAPVRADRYFWIE